jgi:hypothetical protein
LIILIIFGDEYKFLELAKICGDNMDEKIIFRDLLRCPDVDVYEVIAYGRIINIR